MSQNERGAAAAAGQDAARPSWFIRVMNGISTLCLYLAGIALTLIVIINGVNVFCRYVLFWALSWAEEGMVFLMIIGVFLGAVTVTWERIHIRIDAMLNFFHGGARLAAEWVAASITAAVLLPIGWSSWGVVQKLYEFDQRSDALHLPVWIPHLAVPIGLLSVPLVMALVLLCRGAPDHKSID